MISHRRPSRTSNSLILLGIAFAAIANGAATTSAWQPPPDDQRNEAGRDEPRTGPGGRGGERPRDRFRRRIDERRQGKNGPDDELRTEMTDRVMEMLRNNLPEAYAKLQKLRERNPERFRNAIRAVVPTFKEYSMLLRDQRPDLAKGIVEEFKNERRLGELSRQYRDSADDPAKQAQIAQEIESLVRRQAELHLQHMSFRLDQFEKRIKEQQEMLQRQRDRYEDEKTKLDENVSKRVEEIKKGNLRRPYPPPPGGPGMGGPPGDRRGPRDGPSHDPDGRPRPPRHLGPHDDPPGFRGPPGGPPPDEPPPDDHDSGDE